MYPWVIISNNEISCWFNQNIVFLVKNQRKKCCWFLKQMICLWWFVNGMPILMGFQRSIGACFRAILALVLLFCIFVFMPLAMRLFWCNHFAMDQPGLMETPVCSLHDYQLVNVDLIVFCDNQFLNGVDMSFVLGCIVIVQAVGQTMKMDFLLYRSTRLRMIVLAAHASRIGLRCVSMPVHGRYSAAFGWIDMAERKKRDRNKQYYHGHLWNST